MIKHKSYIPSLLITLTLSACGGGTNQEVQSDVQDPDIQASSNSALKNKQTDSTSKTTPTPATETSTEATTETTTAPPSDASSTAALSYQQLLDDMTKPHESYAHGVNPDWGWGTNPRIGVDVNFPSSYDNPSFTPWGVAATATSGSPAKNVRIQLRKMILDVKRNGKWSRIVYNTNASELMGALYTNYETNTHAPANVRAHGADGISVRLPDSGGSFHFMTTNRFPVAHGAQEIVSRVEARLIVDDTAKSDDRASARLLVASGGDIWRNASATSDPNTLSNVDFAIGRFKFVTPHWTSFASHTLSSSAEINDYLANETALSPR